MALPKSVLTPVLVYALGVHLHLHHHFHGPAVDYVGLAIVVAASWAGFPGPGEPALIAAAIFAARHRLDIASVVVLAWLAATAGGIAGWAVGLKAGRALLTARGPLRGLRRRAIERGEAAFARHAVLAIILTPAFVAGINRPRTSTYMTVNLVSAAIWALLLGLGGYYAGPPIVDLASDAGLVMTAALVALVVAVLLGRVVRRRRLARP